MSEATKEKFSAAWTAALKWRLAIWKAFNGALIVALGAIVAGLANIRWDEMDGQSRFLFVCGILLSVLKSLDLMLDQTISHIKEGNLTETKQQDKLTP